jgi:hypothetical protein
MGRNIVIEPNRSNTGSTQQPHIYFSGLTAGTISLVVEDDGSLVYDGTYGGLFSITDTKDGLLHSVNDVSGLGIFQVWDDNRVILGSFYNPALTVSGSTVFVGPTGSTSSKLHISGGTIQYKNGTLASGKVLTSDSNGVATWETPTGFTGGTVTGAVVFTGGLTANTISATTYFNLPTDIRVTGVTYSSNTFTFTNNTGGTFNTLFNTVTGLTVNGNLTVTGDTNVKGLTGTSATISGSAQNILTVIGSGSTSPLFKVSGSLGDLLTVTDSNTTSIFTVNDVSGSPLLEVKNDNRIILGTTSNPALTVSGSTAFVGPTGTTSSILHISGGTIQYKDGTLASGKILTSDGNGVATWQYPTVTADTVVTAFTYNNNTFTLSRSNLSALTQTVNTMTGLTVNGNLTVTGDTNVKGLSGTSAVFSGSSQNILTVIGSGSTSPIFKVQTISSGDVFTVTDNQTDAILNVQNSASQAVLQVWNDDRVVMGTTTNPALIVSGSTVFVGPTGTTTSKLHISGGTLTYKDGNQAINKILTSDSGGTATWQYPVVTADTFVTGFTYSNNTFTIGRNQTLSALTQTVNTMTGLTVNGNLTVTGNTSVQGLSGTSAVFSGSGQNILTVVGSGTTNPLITISGSSGQIFTVTDSLIGSIFSVNTSAGIPIFEVLSDNSILMGDFYNASLYTTTGVTVNTGVTTTIYSLPTSAFTGAFFEYTVKSTDSTGARAGNIMAIWSGTSVNFTETKTSDIGTTTGLTFSMSVINTGNTVTLTSSATTSSWNVKTIIRSI